MNLKQACAILDVEMPCSHEDKADWLSVVLRNYRALLMREHPDKHADSGGLSEAHDRTVKLNEAVKFLKTALIKRRVTITEIFFNRAQKKRASGKRHREWMGRTRQVRQCSADGTLIREWSSLKQAAEVLGIHRSNISRNAHGLTQSKAGYQWEFIT
jgi:DnaJ domain.